MESRKNEPPDGSKSTEAFEWGGWVVVGATPSLTLGTYAASGDSQIKSPAPVIACGLELLERYCKMLSFFHSKNDSAFEPASLAAALLIFSLSLSGLESPIMAEPIKSADGKTIEAEVVDIRADGVTLKKSGIPYDVPWEKLDPDQARRIRMVRWLKVEEDKFEDKISAKTKELGCSDVGSIYLQAFVTIKPMKLQLPKRYGFWIVRTGDDWEWLTYHKVNLLLDDKPFGELPSTIETSTIGGGRVLEMVVTELSDEQMADICTAKKVEMRVGVQEFTLDKDQLAGLSALREFFEWARGVAIRNSTNNALGEQSKNDSLDDQRD